MHAQMQEAHSMRQLELAKSTNIDKLVSGFDCVTVLSSLFALFVRFRYLSVFDMKYYTIHEGLALEFNNFLFLF